MYLLFLSVIATFIIALLVWYIIKVIVFGLILKHVTKKEWRKAINMLISYLRQRTDLIMFKLYMVSMTTIVGIIPPVISLCIQYRDQSHDFKLNTNLACFIHRMTLS